ncbi:MAG TPA: tripartite tricarboxylate transporter substrate binding protein [Burkholderiaceae bacterium]|nr:tripartite tricarboxylate transporter substrate binding protein [Burkholderiaceae bacterium]
MPAAAISKPALFALCAAFAAVAPVAAAESYPSKPIRIIVTGTPGGPPDLLTRWLAQRLAPVLGGVIVVENRPGAGGNVAMQAAARSAPDGYTLVVAGQGPFALNPHMYANPGYNPMGDFAPITQIERGPLLLAVNPQVPVHSVVELIALATKKPGELNYGSPGTGTPPHLASELFNRSANVKIMHVPYAGAPAAMLDLIAGRLTFTFGTVNVQLPQVKAGKIRALAVTSPTRLEALPEIPTVAESGLPGFEYSGWLGIAAPAGTPEAIIERLQREIAVILLTDEARQYFASYGREPVASTPAAFTAFIRAEHEKWGHVIRDSNIHAE